MKMKIVFALCAFVSLVAMEKKECEIIFLNDFNKDAFVNYHRINANEQLKLVVPIGKAISVHGCCKALSSWPVPIIRDENKLKSCVVPLSFLLCGQKDYLHELPNDTNILFYVPHQWYQ